MKNEFNNSDKRLQEKLEGFRMAAPEGAWAGIQGNIAGGSGRGRFFYLWIVLLFIGVTGAGILTFLYTGNDDDNAANSSNVALNTSSENNQNKLTNNSKKEYSSELTSTSNDSNKTTLKESNEASVANTATSSTASQQVQRTSNNSSFSASNGNSTTNNTASSNASAAQNNSGTQLQNGTKTSSSSSSTSSTTDANASSNRKTDTANNTADHGAITDTGPTNDKANGNNVAATNGNKNSKTGNNENASVVENSSSNAENNSGGSNSSTTSGSTTESETNTAETSTNPEDTTASLTTVPNATSPDIIENLGPDPNIDDEKVKPSWSIEGGLDLSSVNFNHSAANNNSLQQSLNASYSQNFAQGAFLRMNYQPFQRFSFHSGLEYGQNKVTQDYTWLTTSSTTDYDTTGWYVDSVTQQQVWIVDTVVTISQIENLTQFKSTFSQVNIPLGVMFHVPLGQKSELGINATGLIGIRSGSTGEILIDENGNTITIPEAYRSVNFSARAALRYSYFIGGKTAIYIEPYLGFGLNDRSNTSLPFSTTFRNSGLRVGFRYNF